MSISKITMTDGVAVVSLENVSADINFLSYLFGELRQSGINVDMISQTAPRGMTNSIIFTVIQSKVADLLKITKNIEQKYAKVKTMISLGNVKFCMFGEDMPTKVGVAAGVFDSLKKHGVELLLITTSDVDISIVVQDSNVDKLYQDLQNELLS